MDCDEQAAVAAQVALDCTVKLPFEQLKVAVPCVVPALSVTFALDPLVVAEAVPEQVCPPTVHATAWLVQSETVLQVPTAAAEPFVHVTVATPTVAPVLSWTVLLLPLAPPA
jgi:hypothetical protein